MLSINARFPRTPILTKRVFDRVPKMVHCVNEAPYAGFGPGCIRVAAAAWSLGDDGINLHLLVDVDVSGKADYEPVGNFLVKLYERTSFAWLPQPTNDDIRLYAPDRDDC